MSAKLSATIVNFIGRVTDELDDLYPDDQIDANVHAEIVRQMGERFLAYTVTIRVKWLQVNGFRREIVFEVDAADFKYIGDGSVGAAVTQCLSVIRESREMVM